MPLMLAVVTAADIDCRRFQIRCNVRYITARAIGCLEPKRGNEVFKLGVIATVKHGIIAAPTVKFYDVVYLRPQRASCEFLCTYTADFFVLAEQHMAFCCAQDLQNHPDATAIIAADPLRRHSYRPVCRIAYLFDRLTVNRVHVGHQQDRNRSLGIQVAELIGDGVTPASQLGFQRLF